MAVSEREALPVAAKACIGTTVIGATGALWWLLQHELTVRPLGTFVMLASLAIFFESLPLTVSYKDQRFQFSIGGPFVLAMMAVFGVLPTALIQVIASLTIDLRARKSWSKLVFNASQFVLSVSAAGAVLETLVGRPIVYPGMSLSVEELPALLSALMTFFIVNSLLTGLIILFVTGWSPREVMKRFLSQESLMEASALLLAPPVAVSMQRNPLLAVLLLIPVVALYRATKVAFENVGLLEERTKAMEEKNEAERRFRSLIQNSSDLICVADPSGRVVYSSVPIRPAGDYPVHDPSWSLFNRIPAEEHAELTHFLAKASASADPIMLSEIRFLHADGTWGWAEILVSNMLDDDAVRGIVLNIRDISDRRRLEDQLRQSQKLEAIGQLAGGVAHDFNNLLSAVQGFTRFARDAGPGEESYRDDLDEVLKASERGVHLVRQLLMFSRKDVVQPQLVDVNATIADLWQLLRTTLTEGVELRFEAGASLPPVEIDPGQLEQVLINLAVNARDAMEGKGTLSIASESVAGDDGSGSPAWVRLQVGDTGCGMDEQTLGRIFEPFFTTKERGTGTGLGLSTVYGIVGAAGGRLSVDSAPGSGTTFVIDLPAASGDRLVRAHEEVSADVVGSETIGVVEDDSALCAAVERTLSRAGYRVIAADSPEAALGLVARHSGHVDLLLTDVVMPRMTGPELAEKVLAKSPTTKLLYMSGYTDNLIGAHELESPDERLLRKPFSPEELLAGVRGALDERASLHP